MPGYDPETWLIFKPDGEVFPPIPDQPTCEEASAALELLAAPIRKFPFKSEVDRAVMLSLFLTGVCRRVLDFAPMHGMSATAAGTGKSMLVDLCSILISGRDAPVISIDCSSTRRWKSGSAPRCWPATRSSRSTTATRRSGTSDLPDAVATLGQSSCVGSVECRWTRRPRRWSPPPATTLPWKAT